MLPIHQVEMLYRNGAYGHANTFRDDVRTHQYTGHILDTPDFFLMWRSVSLAWPLERMKDCSQFNPTGSCVWIWAAAGDLMKAFPAAMDITPTAMYVAYEHRGLPRLIATDRLYAMLHRGCSFAKELLIPPVSAGSPPESGQVNQSASPSPPP